MALKLFIIVIVGAIRVLANLSGGSCIEANELTPGAKAEGSNADAV